MPLPTTRVHHASNPKYIDRNFAGVLIIWDRLFGTFVEEDQPSHAASASPSPSTASTPHPHLPRVARHAARARSLPWRQKLAVLFSKPPVPPAAEHARQTTRGQKRAPSGRSLIGLPPRRGQRTRWRE